MHLPCAWDKGFYFLKLFWGEKSLWGVAALFPEPQLIVLDIKHLPHKIMVLQCISYEELSWCCNASVMKNY